MKIPVWEFKLPEMLVFRSRKGFEWAVFSKRFVVGYGYQHTYDQAFRAARNFIRKNQNAVYR